MANRTCTILLACAAPWIAACDQTGANDEPSARQTIELPVPGAEPTPVIDLAPGRVATVSFANANGEPWPVEELLVGDPRRLTYRRIESQPHVAILQSPEEVSTNLVAILEGLAAPVHLDIRSTGAGVSAQVEVRLVQDAGEDAASGEAIAAVAEPASSGARALDQPAVESIIREYLLANPSVLREALDPSRQLAARASELRGELLASAGVPALGDQSGAVTVVEFSDYRCGFCKRSLDAVRMALKRPGVRVEVREYPILGGDSVRAAKAALAAAMQGRYEQAHLALMAHEGEFDEATIETMAADWQLDVERLKADMDSAEVNARLEANRALAQRLGVTGTPAFLVAGPERMEVSPGFVDANRLRAMIDAVAGPADA